MVHVGYKELKPYEMAYDLTTTIHKTTMDTLKFERHEEGNQVGRFQNQYRVIL